MVIKTESFHSKIYFWTLILLVMSIPLSEFMMSVSQIILLLNWLFERDFSRKLAILKDKKSIPIFISVFLIHIIGIVYSENSSYWFTDVRNKLPLLILPLVIGTSEPFNSQKIKTIFIFFYTALLAGSLSSLAVIFGFIDITYTSSRDISIYISHIRFALLLNLGIFSSYYFLKSKKITLSFFEKYSIIVLSIWFSVFIFILNSLTGILIFTILFIFLLIYNLFHKTKIIFKLSFIILIISIFSFTIFYISNVYHDFYDGCEVNFNKLEKKTVLGNYYFHDTLNLQIENGSYTNSYICEKELEYSWNKRSIIAYQDNDKKGNKIRHTLKRYLTSKGLRKDNQGVDSLKNEDIDAIERGIANHLYIKKNKIYKRIHQTIWEIDSHLKKGNPSGHSLIQRLEFLKTSATIISDNFWFGVGNGDVKDEFQEYYRKTNSPLEERFRYKSHNQFVLFWVAFGFIGLLFILMAIFAPIFFRKTKINMLFKIFIVIAIFSMLNEDTLETQAGITFFVYFYSLLFWGNDVSNVEKLN